MSIIRPTHLPEDCEPTQAEIAQIQRDRLAAVRRELQKRDLTAAVLFDPTHMRYATGSRNMQVYSMRNPARYAFVPAEGKVVLFEYAGCDFLAEGLDTVDEVRPGTAGDDVGAGRPGNGRTRRQQRAVDVLEVGNSGRIARGLIGVGKIDHCRRPQQ